MAGSTTVRRGFRPEIQGLRAVAVLLVIAYHLYPNRVSGGYVGVDVFFVLSGYLITSHLVREAVSTSHLSLTRFWARRIRRLLPASLLVLAVCAVLTWAWVPRSMWDQTLRQIGSSALYVENWTLAADAVDYSAVGNEPTLVQHYWSLSVEEQFYLLWPLLIVGVLALAGRRAVAVRPALTVTVGALVAGSFAYSVVATRADAAHAYFVTPTRVWEFGLGALIALAGSSAETWWRGRGTLRLVVGWVGLCAVVSAGLALSDATAFPGWIAAVPVLGTVAVVAAGSDTSRLAVARPLSWRPATFVGDISYSMYLWHWPLIVVVPFITGVALRTGDKAAIFAATLVLSWACTRWVEDPLRTARFLADSRWRAYALGAAGMAVVVAMAGVLHADLQRDVTAARSASDAVIQQALSGGAPCVGPAALAPGAGAACGPVSGDGQPPIDPAAVARQNTEPDYPDCQSGPDETTVRSCTLGARGRPTRTVAIVGDSHATHWFSALDTWGRAAGWRVLTFTRSSCPLSEALRVQPGETVAERGPKCLQANREVVRRLLADPELDLVLVSAYASAYRWAQPPGGHLPDPATDGFRAVWQRLVDGGKQVLVIRDVPAVKDQVNSPTCLEQHAGSPLACATTRTQGLRPDLQADAVTGGPEGVHLVDLTDQFCDDELCFAVVGDVIVYRDYSHLSEEYSTLLGPYLARAVADLDASAP
jgi:peptidoglycan/LPS O-acetylase OafA/YrhL